MRTTITLGFFMIAAMGCLFGGCEAKKTNSPVSKTRSSKTDHAGHDHAGHDHDEHEHAEAGHADHDHAAHSHDVGPNGGHIDHFVDSPIHFEWTHDDEAHKLTIYLEEAISDGAKIEAVKIDVAADGTTKSFPLASDPEAKIAGSVYTLTSEELVTLLGASGKDEKGVVSSLLVTVDGKVHRALLQHDHDHGHKH